MPTLTRRGFARMTALSLSGVSLAGVSFGAGFPFPTASARAAGAGTIVNAGAAAQRDFRRKIAEIEKRVGARMGAAAIDGATGIALSHRGDEAFPMCSTFKATAAAAVLARADAGADDMSRRIVFHRNEVLTYSPVTEKRIGGAGMTLAELCEAAVALSDNTAGNLLLKTIGGPEGLTAFAREIGDDGTRLVRWEPELNEARPGDPRDVTTPLGMAAGLRNLSLGDALSPASRDMFNGWMIGCKTGDARLRAGTPKDWRIGDKTGTGAYGTTADVGVVWPTQGAPLTVAVYLTECDAPPDQRNRAIADVGRLLPGLRFT